MYFVKTPWWLRKIYPTLTWSIPAKENEVFLTFDDGPHPTITPFVLDELKKYEMKATFFCIGKNVRKHPGIYKRIIEEGHRVGNHTMGHLNGWKTGDAVYLNDVLVAREFIDSNLFRPPYGRISKFQVKQLLPVFNIIMWDVISGDFDISISAERCLQNVILNVQPSSIVVFHDSEKAFPRLETALPKTLEYLKDKGWTSKSIMI
ncbi:polysaccharide deacetylase family protein [Aridibaculum aurantiacum]|uniref:polysaccharide deacetylase family protein n=1 Tax=Aridibaculum aurantiacum TaxID=2810307 RepID=UPI001A9670CA|nr:polysaccharide deacetylase family protein [Aridibaculum aurantiacum]